jgi:hypothetical protein
MALILRSNGEREDIEPQGENETLTLEQLQQIVGGFIEAIKVPHCHNVLIVNEEGKFQNLPINVQASKLAQREIVGDAVICVRSGSDLK